MVSHQNFDDLKAHMLNETIKVIERKVQAQRDILAKLQSDQLD
jgi:hypothetical protein